MRFTIITLFPETISCLSDFSILKKAKEKGVLSIDTINPRDFATDTHKTVDDKPYGGGEGMVIRVDVIYKALQQARCNRECREKIILLSPAGKRFVQDTARDLAEENEHIILISGNYEGIDARVENFIDLKLSIGDFVLSNGELAAGVVIDSVSRFVPGVLGNQASLQEESFSEYSVDELIKLLGEERILIDLKKKGVKRIKLLEYPQFTRPEVFLDHKVPKVLLSGDHKRIRKWRLKSALELTIRYRPDLLQ